MRMAHLLSSRLDLFGHCVTRVMTLKALEADAVNLSQGFPESNPDDCVTKAAIRAIEEGHNQYADMRGLPALRETVAGYYRDRGMGDLTGDEHVSITCGSTEAMIASLMATIEPEDELIIFVPYYENFWAQAVITRAKVVFYALEPPDYPIDLDRLEKCFSPRTKAIILNTPNNPTGRVFSEAELRGVGELCHKYDALAFVDEVYEHILFDGHEHICLGSIDGMFERTVTISSISKVYAASGWRVGWAVGAPELTDSIRRMHDFITATVPTPFQIAAIEALKLGEPYYERLRANYAEKREILSKGLQNSGFDFFMPEGTYYILADISQFGFETSEAFTEYLLRDIGVACVPGSAYYRDEENMNRVVRFTFSKNVETIREGVQRLKKLQKGRR